MQNNRSQRFDVIEHLSWSIMMCALLVFMVSALYSPVLSGLLSGQHGMTVTAAPNTEAADPTATPIASAAEVTDLAPDTIDEGQDVLVLAYDPAPYDLWNGLLAHDEWYADQGTNGHGAFNVPVGTVVDVPGGLYLATLDGWAGCRDGWWAQECSATGPVTMLNIPQQSTVQSDDCAAAAGALLDALNTGTWIEEDLSYRGMPDTVAQCNDQLATTYYATPGHRFDFGTPFLGGTDLRAFLAPYASLQTT